MKRRFSTVFVRGNEVSVLAWDDIPLKGPIGSDFHRYHVSSLQWLEGQLQQLVFEQSEEEASQGRGWVAICQLLIRKGYAAPLLRSIMAVLAQLPLEGHREQLLNLLEERDALLLADSPERARAWRWLRQAAPNGGNGFWA